MKKIISILLAIVGFSCLLTSCNTHAPNTDDFDFLIQNPVLAVHCGDTIEYSAKLINKTNKKFILSHGVPLITLYVYNYGDTPEEAVGASLIKSTIDADDSIEKNISVCFTEQGDYMLRAYCNFFVDDKEYRYEIDPVKISVSE